MEYRHWRTLGGICINDLSNRQRGWDGGVIDLILSVEVGVEVAVSAET